MSRCCSQCGNNGHNSRTCVDAAGGSVDSGAGDGAGVGVIMLFGVRVTVDPMRKSVSMNNLSQYEQPHESSNVEVAAGYVSDDVVNNSVRNRERKRGVPWTEEEHKLFLLGLHKVGKGDWRGISRNFVKTRTPTQVASHAQKYFLRRSNLNRRRRRSSLFDITTDTVTSNPIAEEDQVLHQNHIYPLPDAGNFAGVLMPAVPLPIENPVENLVRPIAIHQVPTISTVNSGSELSLKLSLSSDQNQSSAFQVRCWLTNNGDGSIISVA